MYFLFDAECRIAIEALSLSRLEVRIIGKIMQHDLAIRPMRQFTHDMPMAVNALIAPYRRLSV